MNNKQTRTHTQTKQQAHDDRKQHIYKNNSHGKGEGVGVGTNKKQQQQH